MCVYEKSPEGNRSADRMIKLWVSDPSSWSDAEARILAPPPPPFDQSLIYINNFFRRGRATPMLVFRSGWTVGRLVHKYRGVCMYLHERLVGEPRRVTVRALLYLSVRPSYRESIRDLSKRRSGWSSRPAFITDRGVNKLFIVELGPRYGLYNPASTRSLDRI